MENSKGQSLLGIMIALGVGVGLVLFSMNAFKFASKSKKDIEINSKNLGNFAQLQQLRKNISAATLIEDINTTVPPMLKLTMPYLKTDGTSGTGTRIVKYSQEEYDNPAANPPSGQEKLNRMVIKRSRDSGTESILKVSSITSIKWWTDDGFQKATDFATYYDDVPDLPLISDLRDGTINRVIVRLTYEIERNKKQIEKVLYVVIIMDKMYSSDKDIKPDVLFF